MVHDLVDAGGGQTRLVQPKSGADVLYHLRVAPVLVWDFTFAEDFPHEHTKGPHI